MGFMDKLSSLADILHISSNNQGNRRYQQEMPQYDQYNGQDDYANDPQGGWEQEPQGGYQYDRNGGYQNQTVEEPEEEQYHYENSFGTNGGYVSAGARLRNTPPPKPKSGSSVRDLLNRIRGTAPEPEPEPQPTRQRSNVIPYPDTMERRDERSRPRDTGYEYESRQSIRETEPIQQAVPVTPRASGTVIYMVRRLDEAQEIIEHMLDGNNVYVNMETLDDPLKRRVLDVVSGAAFAVGATVKRVSYRNYLVAPIGEKIVTNGNAQEERAQDRDMGESAFRSGRDRGDRW